MPTLEWASQEKKYFYFDAEIKAPKFTTYTGFTLSKSTKSWQVHITLIKGEDLQDDGNSSEQTDADIEQDYESSHSELHPVIQYRNDILHLCILFMKLINTQTSCALLSELTITKRRGRG